MNKKSHSQKGFSLIEVLIAIVIITAGLIALSGVLVFSATQPADAKRQELAKQIATSIIESVITAKEANVPGFGNLDAISCIGDTSAPGGRFVCSPSNGAINVKQVTAVTNILTPGDDGVAGTCDDGTVIPFMPSAPLCPGVGSLEVMLPLDPGADGKYETPGDNAYTTYIGFTRRITITNITALPTSAKQIDVDVFYPTSQARLVPDPNNPVLMVRPYVRLSVQLTNFRTS